MKQPVSEPSEFTMSSEDFPALPGSHKQSKQGGNGPQHQPHGTILYPELIGLICDSNLKLGEIFI